MSKELEKEIEDDKEKKVDEKKEDDKIEIEEDDKESEEYNEEEEIDDLFPQQMNTLLEKKEELFKITTGSKKLDNLLGGGIESNSITEILGEPKTGKTQLCQTLCITCQIPKSNGVSKGKVIYIDTEGTLIPKKLERIAIGYGLDPYTVFDNLYYSRVYKYEDLIKILSYINSLMSEKKFCLLIVDSATYLFRAHAIEKGEVKKCQMELEKFMLGLKKISDKYKVAVVVTNEMIANEDWGVFGVNAKKPLGNLIMAHACQTRLFLRKNDKGDRICKIYDSLSFPESEIKFTITKKGIKDV